MLKHMRIGVKLGLGFTLVVVLALALGAIAFKQASTVSSLWHNFETVTLEKQHTITTAYLNFGNAVHYFKNYVLRGGEYDKQFLSAIEALDQIASAYQTIGSILPEEEQHLQAILEGTKTYRSAMATLVQLRTTNATISELDKAVKGADKPIATALDKL